MITTVSSTSGDQYSVEKQLVQFARLLRDNGFNVAVNTVGDAVRILADDDALNPRKFRKILQVLFCSRLSEITRFDEIYNAYWHKRVSNKRTVFQQMGSGADSTVSSGDGGSTHTPTGLARYFEWRDANDNGVDEFEEDEDDSSGDAKLGGASSYASQMNADLGTVKDTDEQEKLLAFAERLGRRLRYKISRRRKEDAKGRELSIRKTLRHCVATNGYPFKLSFKRRKTPPVSLLLFVDVSGSMDSYSIFFTRFMHALLGTFARAEAFLFHTRLVHISKIMRDANPEVMMQKMSLISQGWSGGTKIGEALATFNKHYKRGFSGSRTVAIIMSDGFDTGENVALEAELKTLKNRCHRLIWLNPLLGRDSYETTSMGASVLSKYADFVAPAHNLRSLMALEDHFVRA